jgi:WhiB family redox-sensing transcriptional regulator
MSHLRQPPAPDVKLPQIDKIFLSNLCRRWVSFHQAAIRGGKEMSAALSATGSPDDSTALAGRERTTERPTRIRRGLKPVYDRELWRRSAACRRVDSDLFFPIGRTGAAAVQIEEAKAICAACPVRSACLEFALTTNQDYGVWGGHDEDERRELRRQWRKAAHG